MNKIIAVIKNMVTNSSKISNIEKITKNRFFFSYKGYMWSIWEWSENDDSGISLAYYPLAKNISEIQNQQDFVAYSSDEYRSEEFEYGQVFKQLYITVKEKYLGVDKAFEEILKD